MRIAQEAFTRILDNKLETREGIAQVALYFAAYVRDRISYHGPNILDEDETYKMVVTRLEAIAFPKEEEKEEPHEGG